MNALRKVLMPLLLIPLGMFIYVCLRPEWQWENPGLEFLFLLLGTPIVIVNFFAWFHPEIISAYFPVKDDWGAGRGKAVTAAIAFSTLAAFTCVSTGAVLAVADASPRAAFEPSAAQPATSTAFARSLQMLASATDSGVSAAVSTPRESPQVEIPSDQTDQIPVSGSAATSSPAFPAVETDSTSVALESTEAVSAKVAGPTPVNSTNTASPSITSTARPSASCTPATTAYMDAIREAVQEEDEQSNVTTGWAVSSKAAEGLWFVAAKIQSDTETIYPGVWGVFVDSEGYMDLYAVNDVAMQLSYADWGEDSEPVLTMQSDGAQAAYNCAMQAQ
ncbi:MAG TPA: hypothetical protein VHP14_27325 [Anaerolineales bacterium]|nr:hypothetical protein [Anaerolineales bacterium]